MEHPPVYGRVRKNGGETLIEVFATNPDAQVTMTLTLNGEVENVPWEDIADKACADLNALTGRSDGRPMTADEVDAYLAEQATNQHDVTLVDA